ncbi:MAG: PDDEXK nuclease domain-containing protein [Armatimonadetes bacterium]|nr:PDDEXK nuclease domain-containing protein [Armatimonadota bacterium]
MPGLAPVPADYAAWLAEVKARVQAAQQRASLAVNRELVLLYWQIGRDILERQGREGWGAKVIERLAHDLRSAFPDMKGFSPRNLKYMRAFAEAWPDADFVQGVLAQLPWYHQLALLDKLDGNAERRWYAAKALEHNWSRNVLVIQIERRLLERSGRAITNFSERLPAPQSDLARESLKDPYRLDFLGLGEEAEERAIEDAIVHHITRFLIELGAGFAFVGRQVHIEVGGEDFFIDLLFYHLRLRSFVVVELKAGAFKPEHKGQLSFYLSAVDAQMRAEHDGPTIGLLLCKTQNRVVAEYALRDSNKPIGVAEYQLLEALPADLQTSLPSIEAIEQALASGAEADEE